jgi:hypothetical protein
MPNDAAVQQYKKPATKSMLLTWLLVAAALALHAG